MTLTLKGFLVIKKEKKKQCPNSRIKGINALGFHKLDEVLTRILKQNPDTEMTKHKLQNDDP